MRNPERSSTKANGVTGDLLTDNQFQVAFLRGSQKKMLPGVPVIFKKDAMSL